jgi:hypothetical protein
MSVLMVITYVFKRKMRAMYEPVAETLPLEIATALDLDRHWEVCFIPLHKPSNATNHQTLLYKYI